MNNWAKRLALLLALAAVCELALRLGGAVLTAPSIGLNAVKPEDAKKVRILALGESTTADYFSSAKSAWPRQLESRLLRAGIDARVYNEGLPSTTSAVILSRVPEYLEKYRPQIVIAMMGINDTRLRYRESASSRLQRTISRIRLVKLARWAASSVDARLRCRIEPDSSADPKFADAVREGLALSGKSPLPEVEARLRKRVSNDKDMAGVLITIAGSLIGRVPNEEFRAYADRAFDLNPYDHRAAAWELQTLPAAGSARTDRCTQVSRKLLACGRNVPDDLISLMANCASADPGFSSDLASDPAFRSRGLILSAARGELPPQIADYRALHERLRREGVFLVAMQYPTLPLAELESYFNGPDGRMEESFRDITFVSNEGNFSAALASRPYEEVFTDRFRGSWGHTTTLGHGLIADSAFAAISAMIKTRLARAMARS